MEMSDSNPPGGLSVGSLEEENARLKADLEECKIRLFELLCEDNQVSDGTIRKEYDDICESIEKWIDEVFKECDFTRRFNIVLKREPQNLSKLGIDPAIQDSELAGEGAPGVVWLSKQDTCNHIVLSLAIWHFMKFYIFCKHFPIGTTRGQTVFFEDILKVKNKEQDEGSSVRTRKWRSETVTAMTKTLGFRDSREQMLKLYFKELVKDMGYWIEDDILRDHKDELYDDIFIPATQLHCLIRCSTRDYVLKPAEITWDQAPTKAPSWTFRDILTWRKVGNSAFDESQRLLYGITPGLYRCGVENEADLELVKPVVVVYKSQQRIKPSSSLKTPSPSPTRDRTRNTDNLNHNKDKPCKRQSNSERSNDSISLSVMKNIFAPKKKHSGSKQKQSESLVQESRPRATRRRSSRDHGGEQSSSHNSDQQKRADTMPIFPEGNEESTERVIRSSTSDIGFDRGQRAGDYATGRSYDSISGGGSDHQVSVSRVPPGTQVSISKMNYPPESHYDEIIPQ